MCLTETKKETSVCNPLCRKSQENKTKPWQTIEGSVRIQSELARKVINLSKKKNCLQNILLSENLYLVPIQKAFSKQTLDKQMNEIYRRIELKALLNLTRKSRVPTNKRHTIKNLYFIWLLFSMDLTLAIKICN